MNYQSSEEEKGVFPTLDWFKAIKPHVDFKDKYVIDFGCCDGVLSILSKKEGAEKVSGIEHEQEKLTHASHLAKGLDITWVLEDIKKLPTGKFDIGIFSMIIHWIGKGEVKRWIPFADTFIYIYRQANVFYDHPDNGYWFPTQEELDIFMKGFSRKHSELLMEQDNNKKIVLAIYEKNKA